MTMDNDKFMINMLYIYIFDCMIIVGIIMSWFSWYEHINNHTKVCLSIPAASTYIFEVPGGPIQGPRDVKVINTLHGLYILSNVDYIMINNLSILQYKYNALRGWTLFDNNMNAWDVKVVKHS